MTVKNFREKRNDRPYKFLLFLGQDAMMWELVAKGNDLPELEKWAGDNITHDSRWIIAESKQEQNT
jgi:hypothetical protein